MAEVGPSAPGEGTEIAEYLTTNTDLTKVADAIRAKGGTTEQLVYPDGFVTAIGNIQTAAPLLIVVSVTSGAAVTAVKGDTIISGTSVDGTCILAVPETGTWTVTAELDGSAATKDVGVSTSFAVTLPFNLIDNAAMRTYANWSEDYPGTNASNKGYKIAETAGQYTITWSPASDDAVPPYLYLRIVDSSGNYTSFSLTTDSINRLTYTFAVPDGGYAYLRLGQTNTEALFEQQIAKIATVTLMQSSSGTASVNALEADMLNAAMILLGVDE